MPIEWRPEHDYQQMREQAEALISDRDPDDWPTVALALTHQLPVWSQDRDLETTGLTTLTTGQLLDALRDAGHIA
jgi:predicted nucleic acid-binding protein